MKILLEAGFTNKLPDVRMGVDIENSVVTICLTKMNMDGTVKVLDVFQSVTDKGESECPF